MPASSSGSCSGATSSLARAQPQAWCRSCNWRDRGRRYQCQAGGRSREKVLESVVTGGPNLVPPPGTDQVQVEAHQEGDYCRQNVEVALRLQNERTEKLTSFFGGIFGCINATIVVLVHVIEPDPKTWEHHQSREHIF